jgi:hypothetical protein
MFQHLRSYVIAVILMLLNSYSAFAETIPGFDALNTPCTKCCGYDCADSCSNKPFQPSSCKTSSCGPARANVVFGANALQSTNMLFCPGGTTDKPQPYALCFFSGPDMPTGNPASGSQNNTLKCTPNLEKGVANCQCQVYNQGAFYVDINSVLNLGAFWQTHDICGADGSKCKNIAACDANGKQKTSCNGQKCPTCPDTIAPVCDYVAAQPFDKENGLYPKSSHASASRVDLISTFSLAMGNTLPSNPYQLGSVMCNGLYAGCMTAACAYVDGKKSNGSIVNCACPLWQGDYQIGQPSGDLPPGTGCPSELTNQTWVWSAANNVPSQASCK